MPETQSVRLSVLVVTYGSADEIAACLDALLAQQVDGGLEVIVVDNASTDGTAQVLGEYAERVRVVLSDTNLGYAEANNRALLLSSAPVIALVNPDCVVAEGALQELVTHLEQTPGVGMSAALLVNPDGSPQLFARRSIDLRDTLFAFTVLGQSLDRRVLRGRRAARRRYAEVWPPTEPLAVDCPAAACVVLWGHLARPRLFDPRFPLLYNDADLDRRLQARGYVAEVVPSATAVHGYGTSLRRVARARMRAERVAALRLFASTEWGVVRLALLWLCLLLDCLLVLPLTVVGRRRGVHRDHLRGTLGGLGLPGGRQPWLTPIPSTRTRIRLVLRGSRRRPRLLMRRTSRFVRRHWFLWRLRVGAWLVGSDVRAEVHATADIARHVRIEIKPRKTVRLRMEPLTAIQPGAILRLGGDLHVGRRTEIRYDVCLNVNGVLRFEGRNGLGRGSMISADDTQVWEWGASCSDSVTIIDTYHGHDGSPVHVHDQGLFARPVTLGAGSLLGAKCTVMPGVRIGRGVIVGSSSVVTKDLPDGCVAMGAPARPREAS